MLAHHCGRILARHFSSRLLLVQREKSSPRRRAIASAVLFVVSWIATTAWAGEGRLEIDQSCAELAGCFPGDAPGFPVTINQGHSFVLTSDLELSATDTSAIEVSTGQVSLDLNGFRISGPTTCSGNGATLACSPLGSGFGIEAVSVGSTFVRNGSVVGFSGGGLFLGTGAIVEDVYTLANGGTGIRVGQRGAVRDSSAYRNLGHGIEVGRTAHVEDVSVARNLNSGIATGFSANVTESRSFQNGAHGIAAGADSRVSRNSLDGNAQQDLGRAAGVTEPDGNSCSDDGCSRDGRRLYYLTQTTSQADGAPSACEPGFHMASLWELRDVAMLQYDVARGRTQSDSGEGPPAYDLSDGQNGGWIRTGGSDSNEEPFVPGAANCNGYKTSTGWGTRAYLSTTMWRPNAVQNDPNCGGPPPLESHNDNPSLPFTTATVQCSALKATWCVQD